IPDFRYSTALEAVSAYAQTFSRAKLIEQLSDLLFVNSTRPGEAHRAFCALPFDIVCTTNFDFLLEKGFGESLKYCQVVTDEESLSLIPPEKAVRLLKFHGDLHHPSQLITTEDDYDTFITNHPLISTYISNLLISKTALFIGYSLDDP